MAANFGFANAVPSLDATQLASQAKSALAEINARTVALDKIAMGFTRTNTPADAPHDQRPRLPRRSLGRHHCRKCCTLGLNIAAMVTLTMKMV
jgi:hypothetical protein